MLFGSGSIFEFNSKVNNNSNIGSGCIVSSNVDIQKNVFMGAGTVINKKIKIGKNQKIDSNQVIKTNLKGLTKNNEEKNIYYRRMWLYRRYFNKKITCRWIQSSMFRFTDYGDSSVKSLSNNKDFELIKGDIRDKEKLQEAIKGSDAIVHLAAIVGDKPCDAAINASYDINFNGQNFS